MKEPEFQTWLKSRYNPSTERTYLSDMRRVERRFGDLHGLCLSGGIDEIIAKIRRSGEAGENKSSRQEIQAIRTYIRFLDDFLCGQPEAQPAMRHPQEDGTARAIPSIGTAEQPRGDKDGLTYAGGFWHPDVFPREAFVQRSIQNHFLNSGFEQVKGGHADWVCKHPESGERWHIECKGLTTAVGLDFRTGLGQLVQAMHPGSTHFAIAVPHIPAFRRQIERMHPDFVSHIGIRFLLVDSGGSISTYAHEKPSLPEKVIRI